jgi:cysteine synthase
MVNCVGSVPRVGKTPIIVARVSFRLGTRHTLFLKDERVNPTGSIKDRSAEALSTAVMQGDGAESAAGIVESTSGNLGVALAFQAKRRGVRFLAIVDRRLTAELQAKIGGLGGELEFVDEADEAGNFLNARVSRARELADSGKWLWTNQYQNRAAVQVHQLTTGPELGSQVGGDLDELYVSVSTCGTLAGLGCYMSSAMPRCTRIAVDVEGSRALGGPARERHITGIGSARLPGFDLQRCYDRAEIVTEATAVNACRALSEQAGIGVGASTGAAVAACLRRLNQSPRPLRALCLIADGSENYGSTVYNDDWLREQGVDLAAGERPDVKLEVIGTIEGQS